MARKKDIQYYFPPRLQEQLAKIPDHSLTLVEAPSGFGKTTAVLEYLVSKAKGDKGIVLKWYTCFGESPEKTWDGICKLLTHLDRTTGDALAILRVPERETLPDIAALLQKYRSQKTCYLVIDNYQLFTSSVQKDLLTALAACQNKKLRIIIITQPLEGPSNYAETTQDSTKYHIIFGEDFIFDKPCIDAYSHMIGIAFSGREIEQIQAASQGWIAAIRLQLKHYQETGMLIGTRAIDGLMKIAVWNKLSPRAKEILMGFSILDSITPQQAVIMNGGAAVPPDVANLRIIEFFVHRTPNKEAYFLHSILRDFLQQRLESQSREFIDGMLRRAAAACMAEGDYYQAARFFMQVADYEAILSMPFTGQYFSNYQGQETLQLFSQLFRKCPVKTLLTHPLAVINVGIQFFKNEMQHDYIKAIQLVEDFLKNPPCPAEMPERELYRVKGEYEMLRYMLCFNDMEAMSIHHKKAHEYLSYVSVPPRSCLFEGNVPWAVGIPSALSVYWRHSGGLQDMMGLMDKHLPFYTELTGGHGAGGEIAMRAEAALVRGDDAEAEVLCYKARYTAQKYGQTSIRLCAELILARIGILRGNENTYVTAHKNIADEMPQVQQATLTHKGEMCIAHLSLIFGKTDCLPDWLHSLEAIRQSFYRVAQPHAVMLHCWMLLLEKRWAELYALTELAIPEARVMHYTLLQVYHLIFLARAKLEEKHSAEASVHLREALAIALPDRVYLPFAEHGGALLPLLEKLKGDFDGERMKECLSLCCRWAKGTIALRKTQSGIPNVLTPRQMEFLLLAAEGNSNAQIAARCGVTPDNVNKVLRSAYIKLKVKNRTEAAAYILRSTQQKAP